MRGVIAIAGFLAVTVVACDRPIPVALNSPPPTPYAAPYQYPPPPPPYATPYQYPPPPGAAAANNVAQAVPPPASDPLRQWCTEHTNPATCSDVNSCIEYCVQHSVGRDPAAIAAQLKREHEAQQRQQAYQTEAAAKLSNAKQQGYQPITFDDFKLDGKKLAASGAKVMMQGFYQKLGDIELLQPTGVAVAVARSRGDDSNGIDLLTDNASRDVRKGLLRCGDPMIAPLGCQMTIIGHVSMCTMTTLVGSRNLPCVAVEDGW